MQGRVQRLVHVELRVRLQLVEDRERVGQAVELGRVRREHPQVAIEPARLVGVLAPAQLQVALDQVGVAELAGEGRAYSNRILACSRLAAAQNTRARSTWQVVKRDQRQQAVLPWPRGSRITHSRSGPATARAIRFWNGSTPGRSRRRSPRSCPRRSSRAQLRALAPGPPLARSGGAPRRRCWRQARSTTWRSPGARLLDRPPAPGAAARRVSPLTRSAGIRRGRRIEVMGRIADYLRGRDLVQPNGAEARTIPGTSRRRWRRSPGPSLPAVTQSTALRLARRFAAVRGWQRVASLPPRVYRRLPEGPDPGRRGSATRALLRRPEPGSTSADLFSTAMVYLLVYGDAFIGKFRSEGPIAQLGLLDPQSIVVERQGRESPTSSSGSRDSPSMAPRTCCTSRRCPGRPCAASSRARGGQGAAGSTRA